MVAREKEVDNPNTKSERFFILTLILHVHKRSLDPFRGSNKKDIAVASDGSASSNTFLQFQIKNCQLRPGDI